MCMFASVRGGGGRASGSRSDLEVQGSDMPVDPDKDSSARASAYEIDGLGSVKGMDWDSDSELR
jgi:hypothetical protein